MSRPVIRGYYISMLTGMADFRLPPLQNSSWYLYSQALNINNVINIVHVAWLKALGYRYSYQTTYSKGLEVYFLRARQEPNFFECMGHGLPWLCKLNIFCSRGISLALNVHMGWVDCEEMSKEYSEMVKD